MVQSSNDSEPSSPTPERPNVYLSPGLLGQDDNFDKLSALWEQLQLCTVETADPALDLMTFVGNAYYFAIIMVESKIESKKAVRKFSNSKATQTPIAGKFWASQPSMPSTSFAPPPEYSYSLAQSPAGLKANLGGLPSYDANQWSLPHDATDNKSTYYDDWEPATTHEAIGMVYLTVTPCTSIRSPPGELNIGIILEETARRRGYGSEVVRQMLVKAFEEGNFHRVQASLVHTLNKDAAMTMYTQLKFNHEGIRRRSFYSPFEVEWKDVTCLALLDTDWINRPFLHPVPKSLWDEMFARHAREREELLRWEDNQKRLKRTASMETIMPGDVVDGHSVSGNESDYQSATESESDAGNCGSPRRYPSVSEGSEVDSDFDETHSRANLLTRRPSPALSYASSDDHSWRSLSPAPDALAHSPNSRAVTPALSEHSVASVPETDVSMSDGDFSSWDTDFGLEDDHSDAEHHF
ncbi:hypothetical protein BDN71DRAFT_1450754 [Pleurotus eryngii]|uniref:N-acetyltransferase domain-containing protein n=1 Tax=Pleurotus eryngii TaxID=5323 RepID=A0A9P5ZSA7_PLEER|nr:hypothetical protein BDN71DRAFT_1450754 [Pleurotus eryngii]